LANTSAIELAQDVIELCLRDGTWPARSLDRLIERALDDDERGPALAATQALFGIVVERLADLFEPSLCEVYARLFSHIISRALPELNASELFVRYRNISRLRRFQGGEISRVFVLSRVTLGADVAVTSIALRAAQIRFPDAEICLVGPGKNAELFSADAHIIPIPVEYGRGSLLRERLSAALELQTLIDQPGTIVVDPDSRLTQLGLIPVCDDSRYYFFESRAFGGEMNDTLSDLTREWLTQTFDTPPLDTYVAPIKVARIADFTVSLGVGENEDKRFDNEFEFQILSFLLNQGSDVLVDRGAGGEEAARVNALAEKLGYPKNLHLHDGSYAAFASHISQSRLYVGYDSAGQHVAGASKVPLVSIFKGFVCERMFARWRPTGTNAHVIRVENEDATSALVQTLRTIAEVVGERSAT
jgi:ADP-heptose:LPS heptosyltransferase